MTPEAQRIAIAEACGWTKGDFYERGFGGGDTAKRLVTGWRRSDGVFQRLLPDYFSDLNAMHEAENVLLQRQRAAGNRIDSPDYGCWSRYVSSFISQNKMYGGSIHAPASARAKLFLKALGKYNA